MDAKHCYFTKYKFIGAGVKQNRSNKTYELKKTGSKELKNLLHRLLTDHKRPRGGKMELIIRYLNNTIL